MTKAYPNTYEAWNTFVPMLGVGRDIMYSTDEVFRKYIHQALLEFYQDNVQYMEIRYLAWPVGIYLFVYLMGYFYFLCVVFVCFQRNR